MAFFARRGNPVKIIITGNMGYVGPIVVSHLRQAMPDAVLVGIDSALFGHCLTAGNLPEHLIDVQIYQDVRNVSEQTFAGADAVVHLAAISNDPMGTRFEAVTEEVNTRATLRIAELAARSGVRRLVFASSCSIYGFAEGQARSERDPLNPLTAYARSKVAAEQGLETIACKTPMNVTALRFATACGFSSRTRLDLVLNDLVASALATRRISVLSDGTPWRPLIHLSDMARAIEWAITRPTSSDDKFLAINAGSDGWNYQVIDLAEAVSAAVPGTTIDINKNAPADRRSYRVDFNLFKSLAPNHQPQVGLEDAVQELVEGLSQLSSLTSDYRSSNMIRFNCLGALTEAGQINSELRWTRRMRQANGSFLPAGNESEPFTQ
jgi:nucleoside-diphosphate-sugar epimerase